MITKNEKNFLGIQTGLQYSGESIVRLQMALSLGVEEIGCSEHSDQDDFTEALWTLSWLLRDSLLTYSEANVAIAGKPYKNSKELEGVEKS